MGSIASPSSQTLLPPIESLRALFPSHRRGPAHSIASVYAGVALLAFGEEKRIPELWRQIAQAYAGSDAAQLVAAKRLREALVKASPLVGFPRAINALTALQGSIKQTCSPAVLSGLSASASSAEGADVDDDDDNGDDPARRGQDLFDATYGPHSRRVRGDLDAISGGVLGGFAIRCIYGELLAAVAVAAESEPESELDEGKEEGEGEGEGEGENGGGEEEEDRKEAEKGLRALTAKESAGLVFVACLAAGQGAQAKGHMYGARNLGNSGGEIRAAVGLVARLAGAVAPGFGFEGMGFLEKLEGW